jgi:hypothetical protein
MARNIDASFFVDCDGGQYVVQGSPFAVIRNGEMRINIRLNKSDEWTVLNYTSDLLEWGITTDEQLRSWENEPNLFEWVNNPWFEIVCETDEAWGGFEGDVYDTLENAEKECIRLNNEGGK